MCYVILFPTTINRKNPVSRNHPQITKLPEETGFLPPRLSTEKTRFLATILKIKKLPEETGFLPPRLSTEKTRFQPPIPLTQRQGDRKFRPFTHHRVTTQTTAVGFFHYLPTDRQSQPGTFSNSFCSE